MIHITDDFNPESFYQNFEEDLYDRSEDTIEVATICSECKGQVIDGKCIYGCDDLI
jgi:thymidine kinase